MLFFTSCYKWGFLLLAVEITLFKVVIRSLCVCHISAELELVS